MLASAIDEAMTPRAIRRNIDEAMKERQVALRRLAQAEEISPSELRASGDSVQSKQIFYLTACISSCVGGALIVYGQSSASQTLSSILNGLGVLIILTFGLWTALWHCRQPEEVKAAPLMRECTWATVSYETVLHLRRDGPLVGEGSRRIENDLRISFETQLVPAHPRDRELLQAQKKLDDVSAALEALQLPSAGSSELQSVATESAPIKDIEEEEREQAEQTSSAIEVQVPIQKPHSLVEIGCQAPAAHAESSSDDETLDVDLEAGGQPACEFDSCTCCLTTFELEDKVAVLRCGHVFCEGCISDWVTSARKNSGLCPVCRFGFAKACPLRRDW